MIPAYPSLLSGTRIRLTARVASDAADQARWSRDSEYRRLQDEVVARPRLPHPADSSVDPSDSHRFEFAIRLAGDEAMIGFVGLWPDWPRRDAWMGIGIGERAHWGRGYGSEALTLIVQYGFLELNLLRISLTTLESNGRALRAYERAGFAHEGMLRETSRYDGQRYGEVFMGILRSDWETARSGALR
jgi:RimJ/RimL family protein N-acetyltransferase